MGQIIQNNIMDKENIKEAIVKTVAYFDMFDFPLTVWEIWRSLNVKCELEQVMAVLENEIQNSQIKQKNGFYFLAGREEIIKARLAKYNFTQRKFKRALWVARIFKFIPWIKLIALANLQGAHNLRDDSDIDLFIITENKRIWLTRFFSTSILKIFNLRPKRQFGREQLDRDKICLSFFAVASALDFKGLMLENGDIYFIYWLAGLVPIYNQDETYEKLIRTNSWLNNYLPNWQLFEAIGSRQAGRVFSGFYHDAIDLLFGGLEQYFKEIQLKLMPPVIKMMMNKDSRVVINDDIIKTHVNDRREEYRKLYKEKIRDYGKNNES